MILSRIDLYRYSIRFREPVTFGGATLYHREGALIRLTADDGQEGWGEAAPLPNFSHEGLEDTIEQLRATTPELVDREIKANLRKTDNSPFFLQARLTPSARFGLEVSLLNLRAASRGRTLPDLLADRPAKTVYANGLLSGSIEKVLTEASSMREAGYRAVKLKVGRRRVYEDAELVRKVGEILGSGVALRLDANRAWGFDEALEFSRGVSGVRVEYVEEPLSAPARLDALSRQWGLPVALDESLVGMRDEDLGRHAYARAVVLKPTLLGGISRALGLAERATGLGMAAVVSSSYEGGVGMGALVGLAAAVGEVPVGLDTYRALAEDVIEPPLPLPAPTVDVRETMEAARMVDVYRLQPVSVR